MWKYFNGRYSFIKFLLTYIFSRHFFSFFRGYFLFIIFLFSFVVYGLCDHDQRQWLRDTSHLCIKTSYTFVGDFFDDNNLSYKHLSRKFSKASSITSSQGGLITTIEPGQYYFVQRVIDGDTLLLSNGERVRLLGIDTPEKHYSEKLVKDANGDQKRLSKIKKAGEEASLFTQKLCESSYVRLELDKRKRDRYGRILAYVYLSDGRLLNAELLKHGYAVTYTKHNFSKREEFKRIEEEAHRAKLQKNPTTYQDNNK